MVLTIGKIDWQAIRQHGEETYPHESCGVLVGAIGKDSAKIVHAIVPCLNSRTDSLNNRYEISPSELFHIQRDCRRSGREIIGFYHSHPDHPAQWSDIDLAGAHWTGCSYVITAVEEGRAEQTRSFQLVDEGSDSLTKRFEEENIEIL
jgi:proteasome lid subunit RPN8/RPN11